MVWGLLPLVVAAATPAGAYGPASLPGSLSGSLSGPETPAQIRFTYVNPKLQPPKYVLTVLEDGTGHFQADGGGPASSDAESAAAGVPEPEDRPIHISKALREEMFAAARKNKLFALACDAGGKNVAYQGTKTLEYTGPEGNGSCVYNWGKNAQINKLTDQFEAMAITLEEGSKLKRQYEHGRLSLDTELEFLDQMVGDGRAIEVENIAPILQTIAGDEAVLKRVQRRARALLEAAKDD
jgi:hypothetical protein